MKRGKFKKSILMMLILLISIATVIQITPEVEATFAPHHFNGYAKDNQGRVFPDGTVIRAMVKDLLPGDYENHTTTVDNSLPDENYNFDVLDPEDDNENQRIYFFIGNENTSQYVTFVNAGKNNESAPQNEYFNITIVDKPQIVNNSPINGTTGDSFTFNVTVTDRIDPPGNLIVNVSWSHGSQSDNESLSNTGGDYFAGTITLDHNISDMTFTIWATDNSFNSNSSGPHTVTVADNDKPMSLVDAISAYWKKLSHNPLTITATASDNIGVKNVTLWYKYRATNSSSWSTWVLFGTDLTPWPTSSWSFTFSNKTGHYEFYSRAYDNVSNYEDAPLEKDTLCGYDINSSKATIATPENGDYYKTMDAISGSCNDTGSGIYSVNITIYNVSANKYWSGGWVAGVSWLTATSYTGSPWTSWSYTSSAVTWMNNTQYIVNATARDNATNVGATDHNTFYYDTFVPTATIEYNNSATYFKANVTLRIYVNFTEAASGMDESSILINITTTGNGSLSNTSMTKTDNKHWYKDWTIPTGSDDNGNFTVKIYAKDNATNNLNPYPTTNTSKIIDNTPPALSSISSGTPSTTSATITWTTNEAANSTVQYGLTTSYGSTSTSLSYTTSHSRPLSSLSSGTTYHYRVISYDHAGNQNTSSDKTFATASESTSPPIPPPSNNPPTADAGGPYTGYTNEAITFNASGSTDDVAVTGYRWDWTNDGTYDTGWLTTKTTTHSYTSVGTYTVKLEVKDGGGLIDTDTATVTITELPVEQYPPVADADGPYAGLTYQNITFDGSGSTDDGTITNYTWDFGDSISGYGKTVLHQYNISGLFNITLTVTDNDGLTDTNTTTANITLDSDGDGWSDEMEESYETNITDPNDYPLDTDNDGTPDDDSPDGSFIGDQDDDNDGLNDEIEEKLGSNPEDTSDITIITIEGSAYYLADINGDGQPDKLYNPLLDKNTTIKITDGKYYLDINSDGKWDYIYDPATGEITPYEEKPKEEFPWLILVIIVGIIALAIVIIIAVLFKTGYLYIEEVPGEEPRKKEPSKKKEEKPRKTKKK